MATSRWRHGPAPTGSNPDPPWTWFRSHQDQKERRSLGNSPHPVSALLLRTETTFSHSSTQWDLGMNVEHHLSSRANNMYPTRSEPHDPEGGAHG
ncbi:hypothetical protein EYF80_068385 [Liparis tanakae]|uniref:Uncharacterized protein n=1 Tax=Liparis tanakae TaxID=230148 RepID=A0A4Z2DY96_9TELE|nr:hypothetical protein EYF80_068385 [Liparis tanakae]